MISISTWNIQCGLGCDGRVDLERIAAVLRNLDALAEALSKLSVFAHENADRIESIDINPFLVLPKGRGAFAVDALIVPSK